jgi:hypothetical protein
VLKHPYVDATLVKRVVTREFADVVADLYGFVTDATLRSGFVVKLNYPHFLDWNVGQNVHHQATHVLRDVDHRRVIRRRMV